MSQTASVVWFIEVGLCNFLLTIISMLRCIASVAEVDSLNDYLKVHLQTLSTAVLIKDSYSPNMPLYVYGHDRLSKVEPDLSL